MQERSFNIVPKRDYDANVRLGKRKTRCYSPRQMKQIYADGGFEVAGEVLFGKSKNAIAFLNAFANDEKGAAVSPFKTYSTITHKVVGYVAIDPLNNRYVAIMRIRGIFWLVLLLAILSVSYAGTKTAATLFPEYAANWRGDYAVPAREANAEAFDGDAGGEDGDSDGDRIELEGRTAAVKEEKKQKAVSEKGGGAVAMTYRRRVSADLGRRELSFFFANPYYSNQDVALEIVVEDGRKDVVIARSGLIEPGFSLRQLEIIENVGMGGGDYDGYFNVICYDSQTGEKALVRPRLTVVIRAE